ncbi:MAG TPA: aspartate/glutamate racemase family protein [Pyrinomonadaceae bacterium]|nr:aspartate/glutamate racemase family protein [Pyrinomonadaceae bacterium]
MEKRKVAFVHTSPAAVGPLMQFYAEAAPELEITNLLDDGLLRLLAAKEYDTAEARLTDMVRVAADVYGAEAAMVTCSSVSKEMVGRIAEGFPLPVLKIDYPMARRAVGAGRKVGVAATFPPTLVPTRRLIEEAAREAGAEVEIIEEVAEGAYDALLAGDAERHDALLVETVSRLEAKGAAVVVLAQVSMARTLPKLEGRAGVPVLTSLHTSLEEIRGALEQKPAA